MKCFSWPFPCVWLRPFFYHLSYSWCGPPKIEIDYRQSSVQACIKFSTILNIGCWCCVLPVNIFFSLGKTLFANKHALLYSSFIAHFSYCLGIVMSVICSTQVRNFSIALFDGIVVLFAGEVIGCLTFLLVSLLEFGGNSYEKLANANLN